MDPTQTTVIRVERDEDHHAIHAIHAAAFPSPAEARLVDALRAAGRLEISLVAEREGRVVGHIAFSPVSVDGMPGARGLGLGPIAVLPAHQGQGVGARLCEAGLLACRRLNAHFVVVLGEPRYYRRFGFARARDLGLQNEYGVDDEFMVRILGGEQMIPPHGLVRYAPEFALV